jgi:hypothetical protein
MNQYVRVSAIMFMLVVVISLSAVVAAQDEATTLMCPFGGTPSTINGTPCGITWTIKDTVAGNAKGAVFASGTSVWQNSNNATSSLQANTFDLLAAAGNINYARSVQTKGQPGMTDTQASSAVEMSPGVGLLNGRVTGASGFYSDIVRKLDEESIMDPNRTEGVCASCEVVKGVNTFDLVTGGMVGHDLMMSADMTAAPFPLAITFEAAQSKLPASTGYPVADAMMGQGTMRAESYVTFITGGVPVNQTELGIGATYSYGSDTYYIGTDEAAQQFSYYSTRT